MVEILVYIVPALAIFAFYFLYRHRAESKNRRFLEQEQSAGLTEPASLHPVIDPVICVGCSACVTACPEKNVLGIINRKAHLIGPTHCIGHGACAISCPMGAISLVFGTDKRGLDIPHIDARFETNVPGIFIAGELGGMGLIRNAVTQGKQAMDSIRKYKGIGENGLLDVVIVGAGPAGFAASLAAMEHNLRYVVLEQETLGGTVSHYPRGKVVMTAPVALPLIGKTKFKETTKEELLEFWQNAKKQTGVKINYQERVESIEPSSNQFTVKTQKGVYQSRTILLAIGRRGTPRKLGVPGEDHSKVVYRLIDAEQYRGQHVLVVGGGDSALEAAVSLSEQPGAQVALSYRSESFSRAKQKNRDKVDAAKKKGRLQVFLKSQVKAIHERQVELEWQGEIRHIENEAVIVCAGGVLPTPFLKEIGINVETKHGTR